MKQAKKVARLTADTLSTNVERVMGRALPKHAAFGSNPLPEEIARRIVANFKIVGTRGLRDQILIVLADYRDHAWTEGKITSERYRQSLADEIMDPR